MTAAQLKPYISSAAQRYAPGEFVSTWNADLGRNAVGVTIGVEDPTEANPRINIKWMHDLSTELVRSEYLILATPLAFCREASRAHQDDVARKWTAAAAKHEAAASEIRAYSDIDEIDQQECLLNESIAETLRECVSDLLYPGISSDPEEEIKF